MNNLFSYEIINRKPSFREDVCYKIDKDPIIPQIDRNFVDKIIRVFTFIRNDENRNIKSTLLKEIIPAKVNKIKRQKVLIKRKEESGYALFSLILIFSIIMFSVLTFFVVGKIVG